MSLTSDIGKVFEKILKDDIVRHLEENKLISCSQHGFIQKKSCLTNLLEFNEFVASHVYQGKPVDIVYLDFQKAFDKRNPSS